MATNYWTVVCYKMGGFFQKVLKTSFNYNSYERCPSSTSGMYNVPIMLITWCDELSTLTTKEELFTTLQQNTDINPAQRHQSDFYTKLFDAERFSGIHNGTKYKYDHIQQNFPQNLSTPRNNTVLSMGDFLSQSGIYYDPTNHICSEMYFFTYFYVNAPSILKCVNDPRYCKSLSYWVRIANIKENDPLFPDEITHVEQLTRPEANERFRRQYQMGPTMALHDVYMNRLANYFANKIIATEEIQQLIQQTDNALLALYNLFDSRLHSDQLTDQPIYSAELSCMDFIEGDDKSINEYLSLDPNNFVIGIQRGGGYEFTCANLTDLKLQHKSDSGGTGQQLYKTYFECKPTAPPHAQGSYRRFVPEGAKEFVKLTGPGGGFYLTLKPNWLWNGRVPSPRVFLLVEKGTVDKFVTNQVYPTMTPEFNFVGADHCNQTSPIAYYALEPYRQGGGRKTKKRKTMHKKKNMNTKYRK